jgi:hypothetical protein
MENEAKKKAIQDAYGDYWDKVKDNLWQDGWVEEFTLSPKTKRALSEFCERKKLRYAQVGNHFIYGFRPKVLDRLHDNNGWISIKDGFPKNVGYYFTFNSKGETNIDIAVKKIEHINHKVFYSIEFMSNDTVTHYQPIITPPKPIY